MNVDGDPLERIVTAYLDYLIGAVFVLVYASHRFNTPTSNRSTTTWLRYHVAAKTYWLVGLALFVLLGTYRPLQAVLQHGLPLVGLTEEASKVAGALSPPLLAALFLTVLLPRAPYLSTLDKWTRRKLQHMAAIPFEARRVSAELRTAAFTVPDAMRHRVTAELLAEDFHADDVLFAESSAPQFVWTKISVLMRHLDGLEADHGFAAFMTAYPAELAQLRSQYKLLLPKARKCFRLTRDLPAEPEDERSRVPDAVREYRDEFADQAAALLGAIYDFLSRGVLQSRHSYAARCDVLKELGFGVEFSSSPLTLNQHVTLFLLLNTLLIAGFVVAEPADRGAFGDVLFRSVRIAVLYNVAILCAVYRPRRLRLAQRDERGFLPVAWYLTIGGVAAACALVVNVALKALGRLDLIALNFAELPGVVLTDLSQKYPWLVMTFVTAGTVAFLTDVTPGPVLTASRLRWLEGALMAGVATAASLLVWTWLEHTGGRPPHMELGWLMFRSAVVGFAIGALIPSWHRQAAAHTPEPTPPPALQVAEARSF